MKDDRREFFEKELRPQLDSEKILIDRAKEAEKQGKLEDAVLFLETALLVNPNNRETQDKLREIKKLRVKRLALDFVQRFYPSELDVFDIAWRVFKDIRPQDFKQEAVSGALGIVGLEPSELKTPKIIVLLNKLGSEENEALPDGKVKEAVAEIGRATGCSQELIDKVTEFILRG